jgi:hypothetical protein
VEEMEGGDGLRRSVRETRAPDRYEEEVFCICRKGYRVGDFMIACDECDEWYHGDCVGFEEDVRAPHPTVHPEFLFSGASGRVPSPSATRYTRRFSKSF